MCWPLSGEVTRPFKPSADHRGIDICAPEGSPIVAARGGKVVYAGNKLSGFGNIVMIEHSSGMATIYAHNRRNLVRAGQEVRKGQIIAETGQTGNATTPHCHFEVRRNTEPIDPQLALPPVLFDQRMNLAKAAPRRT